MKWYFVKKYLVERKNTTHNGNDSFFSVCRYTVQCTLQRHTTFRCRCFGDRERQTPSAIQIWNSHERRHLWWWLSHRVVVMLSKWADDRKRPAPVMQLIFAISCRLQQFSFLYIRLRGPHHSNYCQVVSSGRFATHLDSCHCRRRHINCAFVWRQRDNAARE